MSIKLGNNNRGKGKFIALLLGISAFLAVLAGLITNTSTIQNYLNGSIFKESILIRNVEKLSPGVTIDVYKSLLGNPTFVNSDKNNDLRAYIFIDDQFYVQAVTDMNDQVEYFAVTTRSKNFNPTFRTGASINNNPVMEVRLGVTRLSDINVYPNLVIGCLGARRFNYSEEYYLGNPGSYEYFGVSVNDAGYLSDFNRTLVTFFDNDPGLCNGVKFSPTTPLTTQNPELANARKDAVVNTFIESSPFIDFNDKKYQTIGVGVDYDQVRVIK